MWQPDLPHSVVACPLSAEAHCAQAEAGGLMPTESTAKDKANTSVTREDLLKGLQEDLSREYQAIIAYVVYSQALKGAEYMSIAKELELHATQELAHALAIS